MLIPNAPVFTTQSNQIWPTLSRRDDGFCEEETIRKPCPNGQDPNWEFRKEIANAFGSSEKNGIVPTIHDKVATHYYSCFARKETRDY